MLVSHCVRLHAGVDRSVDGCWFCGGRGMHISDQSSVLDVQGNFFSRNISDQVLRVHRHLRREGGRKGGGSQEAEDMLLGVLGWARAWVGEGWEKSTF